MDNQLNRRRGLQSDIGIACLALLVSLIFVVALCTFFHPTWETNDDIAMSMVAHGYGIAAVGSPNLIFSNVLWGYLVRLIPTTNGLVGYSLATISVLIVTGAIISFGLLKSGIGFIGSILCLILIMSRPVLYPQFTINAGLLMVGAVISFHLYSKTKGFLTLAFGCILVLFSYLVRSQEFFLLFLVALPLLPWKEIKQYRTPKLAIAAILLAIGFSAIVDHNAYQGPEWKVFNELNPARAAFTDFGAGDQLKQRVDILQRYGYSLNDVDLITNWFFVDPNIANPSKLGAMLKELGPLPTQANALMNAWQGIRALFHPDILAMVLAALLLCIIYPGWRVNITAGLCVSAVFCFGLLGRPGVLRVYIPMILLLIIAPLVIKHAVDTRRKYLALSVLSIAVFFNTSVLYTEAKTSELSSKEIYQGLNDLPSYPIVTWGAGFPYEAAYPAFASVKPSLKMYGLGVFTLAPFSVAFSEQKKQRSMITMLSLEDGLPVIGAEKNLALLDIYCNERLHGSFVKLHTERIDQIQIDWWRCNEASKNSIEEL